eukprot:5338103-Amphidinium_carterae.3
MLFRPDPNIRMLFCTGLGDAAKVHSRVLISNLSPCAQQKLHHLVSGMGVVRTRMKAGLGARLEGFVEAWHGCSLNKHVDHCNHGSGRLAQFAMTHRLPEPLMEAPALCARSTRRLKAPSSTVGAQGPHSSV